MFARLFRSVCVSAIAVLLAAGGCFLASGGTAMAGDSAAASGAMKLLKAKGWEGSVDIKVSGSGNLTMQGDANSGTFVGKNAPGAVTHVEFHFDKLVHRERYRATWTGTAHWNVSQNGQASTTVGGQTGLTGQRSGSGQFETQGTFSLNFPEERDGTAGCWGLYLDPKNVAIHVQSAGPLGSESHDEQNTVAGSDDADNLVGDLPADGMIHGGVTYTWNNPSGCGDTSEDQMQESKLLGQMQAAMGQMGTSESLARHTICWNIHPIGTKPASGAGGGGCAQMPAQHKKKPKNPKIQIVAPDRNDLAKRQFAFDGTSVGVVRFHAEARVSDGVDPNAVRWSMQKVGNAKIQIEPDYGTSVEVVVSGLPASNSSFGKKVLTASVDGKSDSVTVELFFPPEARTHPGAGTHPGPGNAKTPNWFYYWAQTEAGRGYHPVFREESPCKDGAIGEYFYYSDQVNLYPALFKGVCMKRSEDYANKATGFDCYAETLRHENVHRREFHKWWDHVPGVGAAVIRKYFRVRGPTECALPLAQSAYHKLMSKIVTIDADGDLVPDYVEEQIKGCDPHKGISCPGIPAWVKAHAAAEHINVLDAEMDAYRIGWKEWPLHHDDKEDWSRCGKQWKDRSDCNDK